MLKPMLNSCIILILSINYFISSINCNRNISSPAQGKKYAVATDHPLASQVALDILDRGGNVVDALVASSFAISVLRPQSTGIGGGGFALIRVKKDNSEPKTIGYDFREKAPKKSNSKMFLNSKGELIPDKSLFGYAAVATPGMVKGLWEMHRDHGVLDWNTVLEPSIRLAEEGFEVYDNLEESISKSLPQMNLAMKKVFTINDKPIQSGQLLVQKDLGRSLASIADLGYKVYYEGEIANRIHEEMEKEKGYLRREDLRDFKVRRVNPITTVYRGYKTESFPLPSSASFMFQILGILNEYDMKDLHTHDPKKYSLILVESMASGFHDRSEFGGDPQFIKIKESQIYSPETIQNRKEKIDKKISLLFNSEGSLDSPRQYSKDRKIPKTLESYNTTHISIMDSNGNVATSTHSINYIFGSRVMIEGTGIILNDTMDDFSTKPGIGNAYGLVGNSVNSIQPGKTPLSSMSPTIVFQGNKPWFTLGAPGGSFIFTSILNTIVRRIDLNEDSYRAVSGARIHYQLNPDLVFVEDGWNQEGLKALNNFYNVKISENKAKVFLIEKNPTNNSMIGISDHRGQGKPLAR